MESFLTVFWGKNRQYVGHTDPSLGLKIAIHPQAMSNSGITFRHEHI